MPPGHHYGTHAMRGGVPWESNEGSLIGRWWSTVSAANFRGRELFAAVAQSNDPMPACLFSMATTAVFTFLVILFFLVLYAIFGAILFAFLGGLGGTKPAAAMAGIGIAIGIGYLLVLTITNAIAGFILPWIGGGVHYLVLMMVGGVGPGKGYSDTVRAHAYAQASSMLWVCIPGMGGLVSLVFSVINHVNAYDEVHQCGGGKAFLAWVAPFVVCCCCYILLFFLLGTLGGGLR